MRFISGTIAGVVLTAALTCASSGSAQADDVAVQAADTVDMSTAAIPGVDDAAADGAGTDGAGADGTGADDTRTDDLVAELPPRRTDEFGLVGVTWDRGFDTTGLLVEVRLRKASTWGGWEELHIEADDGSEGGQDGTEPLWVGDADGVAVRVTSPTGQRPAGLKVATIDGGDTSTTGTATTSPAVYRTSSTGTVTTAAAAVTPRPAIILRSQWGAAAGTKCDSPTVTPSGILGTVVHHTAGTNSYTAAQSASIVRATQAYHMKARKWCDLGYNFLVDKYGQIFEGRRGGIDKAVRAAHSGNAAVNQYTMGVSMMGTFDKSAPTKATKDAMVKLISWRMSARSLPATGTYSIGGLRLNRIAGHRDVIGTECPGAAAYKWLGASGGLRQSVAAYMTGSVSDIARTAARLGASFTGAVVKADYRFTSDGGGTKARYRKVDFISTRHGLFWVQDAVRSRYNGLKGQTGVLGVPFSSLTKTSDTRVRLQRFHRGTIYRVKRKGKAAVGYAVYGKLENRYRSLKENVGTLGAPTSSQKTISGGRQRVYFAKGTLTLQPDGRISTFYFR